jgi:hypothetical protein
LDENLTRGSVINKKAVCIRRGMLFVAPWCTFQLGLKVGYMKKKNTVVLCLEGEQNIFQETDAVLADFESLCFCAYM